MVHANFGAVAVSVLCTYPCSCILIPGAPVRRVLVGEAAPRAPNDASHRAWEGQGRRYFVMRCLSPIVPAGSGAHPGGEGVEGPWPGVEVEVEATD